MSLTDRLNHPERRGGTERREPRWIKWTRENEKRGKDLTERAA
jgi:ribosomal protein L24E